MLANSTLKTEQHKNPFFLPWHNLQPLPCVSSSGRKKKPLFVCVSKWVSKEERNYRKCECEWVAIDGEVNRRLTTEGWKTLGEALWCVRRVKWATSTGMLGSLSLFSSHSVSVSPLFHSLVQQACKLSTACLYGFVFSPYRCHVPSFLTSC